MRRYRLSEMEMGKYARRSGLFPTVLNRVEYSFCRDYVVRCPLCNEGTLTMRRRTGETGRLRGKCPACHANLRCPGEVRRPKK